MMSQSSTYQIITIAALAGYMLGSTPFGLILTRICGYGDIRKIGSGNIGATNVLRTGRKDLAILTIILDASKAGIIAYIFMNFLDIQNTFLSHPLNTVSGLISGIFAILGHNFPVWLKFKGGKGVASTLGFMVAVSLPSAVAFAITWLSMSFIFRYSSLSAITSLIIVPFVALYFTNPITAIAIGFLSVLSIIRHKENIIRLFKGEESKISFKKKG